MKIKTEDYILHTSAKGNSYIVNEKGENVMVPKSIASKWDDLDEVTLGERKFTKQTDNDPESPTFGQLIDKEWSRTEVTGKKDVLHSANKKARVFQAKTLLLNSALDYENAKKKTLEASTLSAENKKELEAMLNF